MPESPLHRWARRKAAAVTAPPAEAAPTSRRAPAALDERACRNRADEQELPDIDSMTAGSDFSMFMAPGVPSGIRTAALRRLWQLDPSLSVPDGLVEYGEDFVTRPTGQLVRTAFRIGRGMAPSAPEDVQACGEDAPDGDGEAESTEAGLQLPESGGREESV